MYFSNSIYIHLLSFINSNSLVLNDPLIQLGFGNPSDSFDLGFIAHYNDGAERHAGTFRDASDSGKFKLFANHFTIYNKKFKNNLLVTIKSSTFSLTINFIDLPS